MKNLTKLMSLYKPYKMTVILLIISTIISSLSSLIFPLITRYISVDLVQQTKQQATKHILMIGIIIIGIVLVDIICQYFSHVKASLMIDKIRFDIERKIFDKYIQLSFQYYDNNDTGELTSIIAVDVPKMDKLLYRIFTYILKTLISIIGAIIVFNSINTILLLMILPVVIGEFLFNLIFGSKVMRKVFSYIREEERKEDRYIKDCLSGIRTLVSFNREEVEKSQFREITNHLISICKKKWNVIFVDDAINTILVNLHWFLIIVVGGLMMFYGDVELIDIITFLMYSYLITNPMINLTDLLKDSAQAMASFGKIVEILETDIEIKNSSHPLTREIHGDIDFKDVSFSYNNDCNVLHKVDLSIKKGEYVAIVGSSGVGKSTIAGLIPRFYDVTGGSIQVDGINIKDYDLGYLRSQIGVVQQEPYMFHGTVYENIAYGLPGATMGQVIDAAKKANAHKFISKLPNGYNSNIGERGVKLSGGQKQRIAIARLFLTNPPILILDEATSALDNSSQRKIQKTLDRLAKDRTTIVIAHRLSTIVNADRIIVLSENGIEEDGTHQELLSGNGIYSNLYRINRE